MQVRWRASILLILTVLLIAACKSPADIRSPPDVLTFATSEEARDWIKGHYASHEFQEKYLEVGAMKGIVLSMYGFHGSGIIRADAYFLLCELAGDCRVIGAKMGTETADMGEPATVELTGRALVIESRDNYRIVYRWVP